MPFLYAILIIFALGLLLYYFGGLPLVAHKLQKVKAQKIKNFKDNSIGKIVGKSEKDKEVLIAPFSEKECVYYQISIEKYFPDHKGVFYWKRIFDENQAVNFILKDDTGSALIKIEGMQGELLQDVEVLNIIDSEKNPMQYEKIKQYLENKGLNTKYEVIFFKHLDKRIRIKEGIIYLGESVAVKGLGRRELLREAKEEMMVFSNTKDCPLLISDKPSTLK